MNDLALSYRHKAESYFQGARKDLIDQLSAGSHRILEIGCGAGGTGAYAKATGKAAFYHGVELVPDYGKIAKDVLDKVTIGNVEDLEITEGPYDVLIASEVLEHLQDPWWVLKKIRHIMKPGATVFASSPNVSQLAVLKMLLRGRFDLADSGVMDRTHMRWFTPATYAEMFEACGYRVQNVRPHVKPGRKADMFNALTFRRFNHLFIRQIVVTATVD